MTDIGKRSKNDLDLYCKNVMQGHLLNNLGSARVGYIPRFMAIGQLILEKIFKDCYHVWAWWPYWSCDRDLLNIFLFPPTLKATYEIWLQLAK